MDHQVKRQLGLIFGFVFVDLLGYSLILPLLPYYAETFGATMTLVGLLGTSNALAQLVATPVRSLSAPKAIGSTNPPRPPIMPTRPPTAPTFFG